MMADVALCASTTADVSSAAPELQSTPLLGSFATPTTPKSNRGAAIDDQSATIGYGVWPD